MSSPEIKLSQKIAKALLTFDMIQPGDRILVGASGGKDSTSLLYHLAAKTKTFAVPFELAALHVHSEYCRCGEHPELWDLVRSWGIDLQIYELSIEGRLKEGKSMNCYWCSTQRRTEMLRVAEKRGFSKIALGHHMDDILETFFMNMLYKGELSTMLPVMSYDKYPQDIIRPLALTKEDDIIRFAESLGIARIACSCNHDSRSKRREARGHIERISNGKTHIKESIFRSMANPIMRYLMVDERAPKIGI